MQIIFIAGTGRSGSTAFARYLEQQTGAVHVGELRYLWTRGLVDNQLCECRQKFLECPFWSEVLRTAFGDGIDDVRLSIARLAQRIDRFRRIPIMAVSVRTTRSHNELTQYGCHMSTLYQAISDVSKATSLIDSSKDPSYLYALRATRALQISTVHLVRDSRAVAHSWTRQRLRPEVHWATQYMTVLPPWRSALTWLEYNTAIDVYRMLNPGCDLVRYEDFASYPEQTLQRLQRSGLLRAKSTRAPSVGIGHSFSGNPMRFEPTLRISVDNSWQSQLSPSDRRAVTAITAPSLLAHGYLL